MAPFIYRNKACYCQAGFQGKDCSEKVESFTKCLINVTEPALYQGCRGQDSHEYVYSIQGFDPCFSFDFTKPMQLRYELKCRNLDVDGKVINGNEALGFPYEDIVNDVEKPDFQYFVEQDYLKISQPMSLEFELEIRNWKYMSKGFKIKQSITDPLVIGG